MRKDQTSPKHNNKHTNSLPKSLDRSCNLQKNKQHEEMPEVNSSSGVFPQDPPGFAMICMDLLMLGKSSNKIFSQMVRDPGSPSENGFMEPTYLAKEVILHPNHHPRR